MEILPGIYHLKQDLAPVHSGTWTTANVIADEQLAIVDTGVPATVPELILPCLAAIPRRPEELKSIVITHGHGDHFGGNEALKAATGARIMAHKLDAPSLDSPKRWVDTPYHPGPADVRLREGDVLDLGRRKLEIVHLPGHTPGSIGVLIRDEGVLFTGDSLQALGTAVQYIAFYNDPDTYEQSLRKVQQLPVEHIVAAHAYAPFADSHVAGVADVKRFLDISLEFVLGLDAQILDVLRSRPSSDGSATPVEVAIELCRRYGQTGHSSMATATAAAHLRRLARKGEVVATGDEPGASYALS